MRYLTNGLKVYYCPQMALIDQVAPHFLYPFFPLFRNILLREQIDIVHGHQVRLGLGWWPIAVSSVALERVVPF